MPLFAIAVHMTTGNAILRPLTHFLLVETLHRRFIWAGRAAVVRHVDGSGAVSVEAGFQATEHHATLTNALDTLVTASLLNGRGVGCKYLPVPDFSAIVVTAGGVEFVTSPSSTGVTTLLSERRRHVWNA